jgi:nucleotide-binding universal stress UspA family protein
MAGASVLTEDVPAATAPAVALPACTLITMPACILCAVDHTTPTGTLTTAAELARRLDARLVLAHAVVDVIRPRARNDAEREQMRLVEILAAEAMLRQRASEAGVDEVELRCAVQEPVEWLRFVAHEESAELIVVAPRDLHPIRKLVSGSVSSALARSAPCPVLAVPPRTPDRVDAASVHRAS